MQAVILNPFVLCIRIVYTILCIFVNNREMRERNMARESRDGRFVNCKITMDVYNRLQTYSSSTRIPKTAIVENALSEYLSKPEVTKVLKKNKRAMVQTEAANIVEK